MVRKVGVTIGRKQLSSSSVLPHTHLYINKTNVMGLGVASRDALVAM